MNEKSRLDITLIDGSIEKWRNIVFYDGVDLGTYNCPLCRTYHEDYSESDKYTCTGCPIREYTELAFCSGTPYEFYNDRDVTKVTANFMLSFLYSVRLWIITRGY